MSGMDKIKNKVQDVVGQGKEKAGEATDDDDLRAEGKKDQAAGNLKDAGENIKDAFKS